MVDEFQRSGEGQIREAMVRGDVVEVMVALPGQLFSTPRSCLPLVRPATNPAWSGWRRPYSSTPAKWMWLVVERVLTDDIAKVAGTVHAWRGDGEVENPYEDILGSATPPRSRRSRRTVLF